MRSSTVPACLGDLEVNGRAVAVPGCRLPKRARHRHGGKPILLEDSAGNLIELFEPFDRG